MAKHIKFTQLYLESWFDAKSISIWSHWFIGIYPVIQSRGPRQIFSTSRESTPALSTMFITSIGKYYPWQCTTEWRNFYSHTAPVLGAFSYFSTRTRWVFYVYAPRKVARRYSLRDNVARMCLRSEYEIFNVTSVCRVRCIDVYCQVVLVELVGRSIVRACIVCNLYAET